MSHRRHAGFRSVPLLLVLVALTRIGIVAEDRKAPTNSSQQPYNQAVGKHDWPQLGGTPQRNNTPEGQDIPTEWNVETGRNIKWSAKLGSQTFGNTVVANGRIYVGTNNGGTYIPRYPWNEKLQFDLGVLLCFRESDGEFLWQYSGEKLPQGRVHDWPLQGICSAPMVEGDRLWFVTNRGEVVCADAEGFGDNEDDGPVTGVWTRKFEIVADVSNWKTVLAKSELPEDYRGTLGPAITQAGLTFYGGIRQGTEPNQWIAANGNQELWQIQLTKNFTLTIEGLGENNGKKAEVDLRVLSELKKGRISPLLRLHFESTGVEVPENAVVTTRQVGKAWSVTGISEGKPCEVQLDLTGSLLACRQKVAPPFTHEADVVWSFDMMQELRVRQHNMATCAPTIWGDVLFVCTSNGVDESHINIPAPDAPSFIALNKHTGKVLWTDNSPGKNILHGQWSCPAVGVFDGVPQVIFPGGDGWLRSFRADKWNEDGTPILLWKFDGNPKDSKWVLGGRGTRNNIIAVPVIYDGFVYLGMGQDPEHGEGQGHLWCIDPTKRGDVSPDLVVDESGQIIPPRRMRAIELWKELFNTFPDQATWTGLVNRQLPASVRTQFQQAGVVLPESSTVKPLNDGGWLVEVRTDENPRQYMLERRWSYHPLSKNFAYQLWAGERSPEKMVPNPNSAVVWHYANCDLNGNGKLEFEEVMHRTVGSPAIKNDILFIADFSGLVHCLNAKTGKPYWTCDLWAACWSTPLIVDEKVHLGDEDGDVAIFSLSPNPRLSTRKDDTDTGRHRVPLHEINMGNSVYTMPVVANNVLYISTKNTLYAIENAEILPSKRDTPSP